ncbi:MAG: TPM domain-containing protein [Planctomycetes bacterium]|nr:TPM domain-containing protein [Planctomycetota bacterium]
MPAPGAPAAPAADSSLERVLSQFLRLLAPPTDPASYFTDADREAIAAATGRAESGTSAEIRLAVVARCRRRSWYLIGQSGVAIAAAAVVASALLFFFAGEDPEDLYGVPKAPQSSVSWGRAALDPFLVTGLSLAAAGAGWFFAAYGLRAKAIRETADRIWTSLRMEQTRERTGILLLVALEERLVRIHVDRAIAAKLPPDTWKTLVGEVASGLSANEARPGAAARAAAHAIEEIGGLVAKDLPRAPDDVNELPDEPYVESK